MVVLDAIGHGHARCTTSASHAEDALPPITIFADT